MAVHIETMTGQPIYTARQWRAHVLESDPGGLARFFDGLDELAYTWCAGGRGGVPEEVSALLSGAWPEVNILKVVATPQLATGVGGAMFWADLLLNAASSDGGLVAIVMPGKRSRESDATLASAAPSLAAALGDALFGRAFLESGRAVPELASMPLKLAMASAAALHTAKANGAGAAAVVSHQIITPATFKDDVSLSRSTLAAFSRALGIKHLQPGVLTRTSNPHVGTRRPSLWLGMCVRTMPAVPWIS